MNNPKVIAQLFTPDRIKKKIHGGHLEPVKPERKIIKRKKPINGTDK